MSNTETGTTAPPKVDSWVDPWSSVSPSVIDRFLGFSDVTELAGADISSEQLERMSHRYHWAASCCKGKDIVEAACGSGQGLGILSNACRSLEAGDCSSEILSIAQGYYGSRVKLAVFDAQTLPFAAASKDVVILFEAIYYLPDASLFVRECRRVLRPGGRMLIATANKDLSDFNPSLFSHRYYGAVELAELLGGAGFDVELYGYLPVEATAWRQRVFRPVKRLAVALGIVPKTMKGKKLLKRLVFGKLVPMPAELPLPTGEFVRPQPLPADRPDRRHKVLYCCATLRV